MLKTRSFLDRHLPTVARLFSSRKQLPPPPKLLEDRRAAPPVLLPVYRRSNIEIARGDGAWLEDTAGKRYLDFASGIATNSLGHGHPAVVEALKDQADILWHASNLYRHPLQEKLAKELVDVSFADTVFFSNSGSEAVETGLKMIRRHHDFHGRPERYRMIVFEGGFHGRSMACISAATPGIATEGYAPLLDGFDRVPPGDLAAVRAALTPYTAGILVEPVQGEGGVRVMDAEFLRGLRELANEFGLLLFFDEVQCGYGRTGHLFAHEEAGVTPDIISLAKGMGAGFPLAATLATASAAAGMAPGSHGSTYGGNLLGMAVGLAALEVINQEDFLKNVRYHGSLLRSELRKLASEFPSFLAEVRGTGLMIGLEMTGRHRDFADYLREAGLMTAPAYGQVIRFLPPLTVTEEEIMEAVTLLRGALESWKK